MLCSKGCVRGRLAWYWGRAAAIRALLRDEPRLAAERAALAAKRTAYRGFSRGDLPADSPASFSGEGDHTLQLRRTVRN